MSNKISNADLQTIAVVRQLLKKVKNKDVSFETAAKAVHITNAIIETILTGELCCARCHKNEKIIYVIVNQHEQ